MTVDPTGAEHHQEHEGETYYFSSSRCLNEFKADRERYLTGKAGEKAPFTRWGRILIMG